MEIKEPLKIETYTIKLMECSKSNAKKKIYSINVNIKKKERCQINNLTLHLMELEKQEQSNQS